MKELWDNLFHRQNSITRTFEILKECILFRDLNNAELEMVFKIMNPRDFKAGELIFRQGDTGVGMYIILSGSVGIFLEELLENQETRRNYITKLGRGDFFGESSLVIEKGYRSASVIVKEDSQFLSFFHPDLKEIIDKNPKTGNKILMRLGEVLGTRLRETNKKIIDLISEKELNKNDSNNKQIYSP